MNLEDLQAFVQIYHTKNISHAAVQLNMTQSALSKRLKNLQRSAGIELINTQNHRQLKITDAGESFYHYAKLITTQYDLMQDDMQAYQTLKRGSLVIGTVPVLAQYGLTQAFTDFMTAYPQINLRLQESEGNTLIEQLQTNQLDLAIARDLQTDQLAGKSYQQETICHDQLMVILAANHPLAHYPSVTLKQLAAYDFTLLPPGSGIYERISTLCAQAGFTPNIRFESTHIETILSVVAHSQQVTLLFRQSTSPFMTTKLCLKPLAQPIYSNLKLITPRHPQNAAIIQMRRYLKQTY